MATESVPAAWLDPATADEALLATLLDVLIERADALRG